MGGEVCFDVDEETAFLLPREHGDTRMPWFCFREQNNVKHLFEIDDDVVFGNITVSDPYASCYVSGEAKVTVANYHENVAGMEITDLADLVEIVEKVPFVLHCEQPFLNR